MTSSESKAIQMRLWQEFVLGLKMCMVSFCNLLGYVEFKAKPLKFLRKLKHCKISCTSPFKSKTIFCSFLNV